MLPGRMFAALRSPVRAARLRHQVRRGELGSSHDRDCRRLKFARTPTESLALRRGDLRPDKRRSSFATAGRKIAFSGATSSRRRCGEAGIRVIGDGHQLGYGASVRPEAVEDYDMENLTGDLVGLRDQLNRQGDLCRPRLGAASRMADAARGYRSRSKGRSASKQQHIPTVRRPIRIELLTAND